MNAKKKLQQRGENWGPKPGTREWRENARASRVPVNELNVSHRRWKKTMKKIQAGVTHFQGRVERVVLKCWERELWYNAEDKIYGGP